MINNTTPSKKDIFANIATDLVVNSSIVGPFIPMSEGKPPLDTRSGYDVRQDLSNVHGVEGSELADSMELPTADAHGSDGVDGSFKEDPRFANFKGMRHIVNPVEYKAVFDENGERIGIARGHFDFAKEIADLTGLNINDAVALVQSNPVNAETKAPNPESGTSFGI